MRLFVLIALAAGCAAPEKFPASDGARKTPEGRVPWDAERHVAGVFVGATCDDLAAGAKPPVRSGFYVNPKTLATDAALYDFGTRTFPEFAVIDADGCRNAQYASLYREFGLLFLRVYGEHDGAMPLDPGTPLLRPMALEFDGPGAEGRAKIARISVDDLPRGPALFGAPLFDEKGRLVGMLSSGITDELMESDPKPVIVRAKTLANLLRGCGPCEDD